MDDRATTSRIATAYFTEVGQYDLPTREEEVRLFTAYAKARTLERLAAGEGRAADAARFAREKGSLAGRIAEGYVRFVIKQATRRTHDRELLLDLIGAGNVGLMEAIDRFEVERGLRFLTYGAWWINVHMQDLTSRADAVHVPNHTRKEIKRRKKEEDAARAAGVALTAPRVIEPSVGPLDPGAHADPSSDAADGAHAAERDLLRHMDAARLPMRERLVLIYAYGLRDTPARTLAEMSQLLYELDGSYLPCEKLRQLKVGAEARLRDHLRSRNIQATDDLL